MTTTAIKINKGELRSLIKESVREVFSSEIMKTRSLLASFVSEKEQKNIEKLYKKPTRKISKAYQIEL